MLGLQQRPHMAYAQVSQHTLCSKLGGTHATPLTAFRRPASWAILEALECLLAIASINKSRLQRKHANFR